jgi:hypothetical protein
MGAYGNLWQTLSAPSAGHIRHLAWTLSCVPDCTRYDSPVRFGPIYSFIDAVIQHYVTFE